MKKVFYLLFTLLTAMSFVSCDKADDPISGDSTDPDIKLSISTTALQYEAEGGTQLITITTNAKYAGAESFVDWVSFKINGTQLQVIVEPNPSTEERTGKIIVSVGATSDYQATNKRQSYVYATVTQKGASQSSQIKGPKWVLKNIESPSFTERDFIEHNAQTIYKVDSLNMEAAKTYCRGYYSETVFNSGGDWDGGSFLFRYEISQIPQELKGGAPIALYYKGSLPRHNGANNNNNDYAQWAYYHCFCYIDCQIDGNKIRSKEEDRDKYNEIGRAHV